MMPGSATDRRVDVRQWGPHVFAAFVFDADSSPHGESLGVFDTRTDAEQAGWYVIALRAWNRDGATETTSKIVGNEHTSSAEAWNNEMAPPAAPGGPQQLDPDVWAGEPSMTQSNRPICGGVS